MPSYWGFSNSISTEAEEDARQWYFEGGAIAGIGPELVRMLTGQTNPILHVLKDDLLFRM